MKDDLVYLRHILEAIRDIDTFTSNMGHDQLASDKKTLYAVLKELEIIGEATAHLSEKFRSSHPGIPYSSITGMRNRLIHEYFDVDTGEVWKTCQSDIPTLKKEITSILGEREKE